MPLISQETQQHQNCLSIFPKNKKNPKISKSGGLFVIADVIVGTYVSSMSQSYVGSVSWCAAPTSFFRPLQWFFPRAAQMALCGDGLQSSRACSQARASPAITQLG